MYSYQHRYHAGSFADLHKHLCLLGILQHLQQKDTAFGVLDAYAGEGLYDLNCPEAQKNKEYLSGIACLKNDPNAPQLIQELLSIQQEYQSHHANPVYPGSPAIIRSKLRIQDRAILIENHPQAHTLLKHHFGYDPQLSVHKRDALEALNAFLPFPEKRGLILIDPSYEVKEEYSWVIEAVQHVYQKFPQGIYAIWYPMLYENRHLHLLDLLARSGMKTLICEWEPHQAKQEGLYGSGMAIINPPWQLDHTLNSCFRYLKKHVFKEADWKIV